MDTLFYFRLVCFPAIFGAMAIKRLSDTSVFITLSKTGAEKKRKHPSSSEIPDKFSVNLLIPKYPQH